MKKNRLTGPAVRVGDHIDTDAIIPARYLSSTDPQVLAEHCLEMLDAKVRQRLVAGAILVAGSNFGCGSSREHAPVSIRARGIQAVIAGSFARIFFRNGINLGLLLIETPEAADIPDGSELEINPDAGTITVTDQQKTISFPPLPKFVSGILDSGGLTEYLNAGGTFEIEKKPKSKGRRK